ncbi:hypothetical protein KKF84_17975 [Myxococcota bacterium]|nr:hypothetical protein [Myxococcota bacterium]MBU1537210.1 hypothetical protein [Myxococcota bacterium]
MTFILRSISTVFFIFAIIGCNPRKSVPMMDAPEMKTSESTPGKTARKRPTHPLKLFAEFDKCTRFKYCKALDYLNLYFSSGETENNYKLLTGVLSDKSPRIQAFALFRLFSFKDRPELVPFLTRTLEQSQDKTVLKLALSLLFLNGTRSATDYIIAHWEAYPKVLKMEVVWVIRKVASHLPMEFIQTLSASKLPALRALALEVGVHLSQNLDHLVTCVKARSSQSGFCALAMARFTDAGVPSRLAGLFAHFQELSKGEKRLLRAPPELIETLEKLAVQGRVSPKAAFELASTTLANRRLADKIRAQAAFYIGRIGGKDARIILERYRKDRRRRVGYAVRRAIYLLEKTPT